MRTAYSSYFVTTYNRDRQTWSKKEKERKKKKEIEKRKGLIGQVEKKK